MLIDMPVTLLRQFVQVPVVFVDYFTTDDPRALSCDRTPLDNPVRLTKFRYSQFESGV